MESKFGILVFLLITVNLSLYGQIEISLKDKVDDTPIPYAVIYQPNENLQFVSNAEGLVRVDVGGASQQDSILVVVSHLNYRKDTFGLKASTEFKTLYLEKKEILLEEVKVTPLNIRESLLESYTKTKEVLNVFSIAKATYHQEFRKNDKVLSLFLGSAYYVHSGDIKVDKYSKKKDVLLIQGAEKYEAGNKEESELEKKVWSYLYWELLHSIFSDEGYSTIFSEQTVLELSGSVKPKERVFVIKPNTKQSLFDSLFLTVDRYTNLIRKMEVINFISDKPLKDKFELMWQEDLILSTTELSFSNTEDGPVSLVAASMQSEFTGGLMFSSGFNIHAIPQNFEFERKARKNWPKMLPSLSAQEINPFLKKKIEASDMAYFESIDIPSYLTKPDAAYYRSLEGLSQEGRAIDEFVDEMIKSFPFF